MKLRRCIECSFGFDDNDGKPLCKTCEDFMVEGNSGELKIEESRYVLVEIEDEGTYD